MNPAIEVSELIAFARTVDAKSLSRAAVELGIPRATIGRRLARLEQTLGVRLLRRTTRSLVLTDAGEAFYRNARIAIDAVDHAVASVVVADEGVSGELRVSMPPMNDSAFSDMLMEFAKTYPRVRLRVDVSTRFVDLQREGYDVAIRAGTVLEPGLIARTLARSRTIGVAAPAYLAEMGTPTSAKALAKHRCVAGFVRGELPMTHWVLADGSKLQVNNVFSSNAMELLLDATLRGHGIAYLPELLISDELHEGRLVQVLPGVLEIATRVAIVYRERELMPPAQRAFIEAVSAWALRFPQTEGNCRKALSKRKR